MPEVRIVDASPWIFLDHLQLLETLRIGARRVVMPDVVSREVAAGGPDDPAFRSLVGSDWVEILPTVTLPVAEIGAGIDPGEASVLALAMQHEDCEVVINDMPGRRRAAALRIPTIGTLSVLLRAKASGMVERLRPNLVELIEFGMYLSPGVIREILELAGEWP